MFMRKIYKLSLILLTILFTSLSLAAQDKFFTDAGSNATFSTNGSRMIFPDMYRGYRLNTEQIKNFLWSLPAEESVRYNHNAAPVMEIPMPDGKMARFHVWESSVMQPALAAKFPEIRTFAGQGIDDPYATIRMGYNPYYGFTAQILSVNS